MKPTSRRCRYCGCAVKVSETGTVQGRKDGLSYCSKAPTESPSHAIKPKGRDTRLPPEHNPFLRHSS